MDGFVSYTSEDSQILVGIRSETERYRYRRSCCLKAYGKANAFIQPILSHYRHVIDYLPVECKTGVAASLSPQAVAGAEKKCARFAPKRN